MKKVYLALALIMGTMAVSFGQTKSSGTVTLTTGFTLKVDVDSSANLVTFTMAGPAANWLTIGLNVTSMTSGDCVSYNTALLDQRLCSGQCAPTTDATKNLTLVSANTAGSTKTIVFTRPLNTGDSTDYTFNYSTLTNLNIIWSIGASNTDQEHATSSKHGSRALSFTMLGTEDFVSPLEKTTVSPNPSNGIFKITKSVDAELTMIKVFDINAKLLKEINPEESNSDIQIDMTGVTKGIYFLELSNGSDKTVKKIQVN